MTEQEQNAANLIAVATAASHGERLAVVETHVSAIQLDVIEIKGDVKTLLGQQAGRDGVGAYLSRAIPWVALIVSTVTAFSLRGS